MLCRHCTLMFETIDQQTKEIQEHERDNSSNCTSLEELLLAVAEGCYICCNIHDELHDDYVQGRLENQESSLLSRQGFRDIRAGEVGARICYNTRPAAKSAGVKTWDYRLIPASQQTARFGFDLVPTSSGDFRAVHRLYENISSSTGSEHVAALVRHWFQGCKDGHAECRDTKPWQFIGTAMSGGVRRGTTPSGDEESKWYPPRLLDVSSNPLRLVTRRNLQQCPAFAAMSHCWGHESFLTLTTSNQEEFETDGLNYIDMPLNFRNVVEIVRWLGIRYVWIDSLCIIQSGPEAQSDWLEHADCMHYVYSSCEVCISTAATDSATKSCFTQRNIAKIAPTCVVLDGEPHLLIDMDHAIRGFQDAPIASRAWVLQERLLSRRILTFGPNQIFWECNKTEGQNVCETFPEGLSRYGRHRGPFALPPLVQIGNSELPSPSQPPSIEDQLKWLDLIQSYSECQLTRPHQDKFVAFAGIAHHMHGVFGKPSYIAGFFVFQLPAALLWHVQWKAEPVSRPISPRNFYRAPSWSWAATDATVRWRRTWCLTTHFMYYTTLLEHYVEPAQRSSRFGQLAQAALALRAPLIPMTWSGNFPETTHDMDHACYKMPLINHEGNGRMFSFDSQDDFYGPQDDVHFMPILGYDNTEEVEGLIVRRASLPPSAVVETSPCCYMRIGMASICGNDLPTQVKAAVTQDFALL